MKTIILRNITSNDITLSELGITILKNDTVNIDQQDLIRIYSDQELFDKIQSNTIKVNDGTKDLSFQESKMFLQPIDSEIFSQKEHIHSKLDIEDFDHNHSEIYFTKQEISENYSPMIHNHNDLYHNKNDVYTKTDLINGLGEINWSNLTDKPSSFNPSAHVHIKNEITDFDHSHLWSHITDKPSLFTPSSHELLSHTISGQTANRFLKTSSSTAYSFSTITTSDLPTVTTNKGGLNKTTVAQGDILFGSSTSAYSALAKSTAANQFLKNSGTNNNPQWQSITKSDILDFSHNHQWTELTNIPLEFNPSSHDHNIDDIIDFTSAVNSIISLQKSIVNGIASLDDQGKIPISQIPATAITDIFVVNNELEMLGLTTAEIGDISIRTDLNKSFILKQSGYNNLSNWQELLTPTDSVTSVNGKTGSVILSNVDVGAAASTHNHTKDQIINFNHNHLWADITDKPVTFSPSTHEHNSLYYTKIEIDNNYSVISHNHDERYYTEEEIDILFLSKSNIGHKHLRNEITDFSVSWDEIVSKPSSFVPEIHNHDEIYYTKTNLQVSGQSQVDWNNLTSVPSTFTPSVHNHDDKYFTKSESDSRYSTIAHNHNDLYYTKINLQTSGQAQVSWDNLTSVPSTFIPSTHNHDDRYYTESESDSRYATIAHNHNDLYYTKTQIDTKLSSIDFSFISGNDSSTNVTGSELEQLTNGSNADGLHTHENIGGGSGTLDDAYGAWGSGRTINVDWGSVELNAQGGFAPLKLTPVNYTPNQWLGGGEICVKDNELYLYDSTRSSFLSTSTFGIQWASNSNNVSGYIFYGAAQTNSSTGFVPTTKSKIVGISAVSQDNSSDSISIIVNGYVVQNVWWQSGIISLNNLNIDVNSSDVINLYLNGSGSSRPNRPCITLFIKSRI